MAAVRRNSAKLQQIMVNEQKMRARQSSKTKLKSRQRGAVVIIVAVCLVALVGMLGLVVDLGHLYVTKTELQNAADAAALSGAKELNGGLTGINNATARAIEAAGRNQYNLHSQTLLISASDIRVGSCPSAGCMVPITSITTDALAANKIFLEVDTGSHNLATWFAQVLPSTTNNMPTSAVAVAGKYAADITPIAICRMPDSGTSNEFGYERGVSYKVSDANPIAPGTMFWIDPESNVPGVCSVTNANATRPYVCTGKTAFIPMVGGTVNTNTGISTSQLEALDSRFDLYGSQGQCDPATAPPDTNVKEYIFNDSASGSPSRWMGTDPVQQSLSFVETDSPTQSCGNGNSGNGNSGNGNSGNGNSGNGNSGNGNSGNGNSGNGSNDCRPKPYSQPRTTADYGVLWSRYRPTGAVVANWPTLYHGNTATSYPETSPYAQTSGAFFQAPAHPGVSGRRVLNMVILQCPDTAGGNCRTATVLGVGRFFMQRKSTTASNEIYVEFGGLLPTPLPSSEIRLYR